MTVREAVCVKNFNVGSFSETVSVRSFRLVPDDDLSHFDTSFGDLDLICTLIPVLVTFT